jgi:hypothetical protein
VVEQTDKARGIESARENPRLFTCSMESSMPSGSRCSDQDTVTTPASEGGRSKRKPGCFGSPAGTVIFSAEGCRSSSPPVYDASLEREAGAEFADEGTRNGRAAGIDVALRRQEAFAARCVVEVVSVVRLIR